MIYESQNRKLELVKETLTNNVNTVMVCRDMASPARDCYTVVVLKDHHIVKQILSVFEQSEMHMKERVIDAFSWNGEFVLVFPYMQERPVADFYMGSALTLEQCEDICINAVISCIDARLPWSVLYLILHQGQVNISKDGEIYFGYQIDFSEFDPERGEAECVECAAVLLRRMLEPKAAQKAVSYVLLEKRIENDSYKKFTELYRDIRISSSSGSKKGILARLKGVFMRNRDGLFRILFRLSAILMVVALAAFITQLVFGDVVWLAFLFNHFKVIGTEALYK